MKAVTKPEQDRRSAKQEKARKAMSRMKPIHILCLAAVLAWIPAVHARAAQDYRLTDRAPRPYKVITQARLDMVFNDGVMLLYVMEKEDILTMTDTYYILYKDNAIARMRVSWFSGKLIKARIVGEHPSTMPQGVLVEIASDNLARPKNFEVNSPEKIGYKLEPVRMLKDPSSAYGITGHIDVIPSANTFMAYFGFYTGMLPGDVVHVCDGLWRCLKAKVNMSTKTYVYFSVTEGDITQFKSGDIIMIRGVAGPTSFESLETPTQHILPSIYRMPEPQAPQPPPPPLESAPGPKTLD
jgi:hypothetical protein